MIERIAPGMTGISLVTLTRPKVARGCEIRVTEIAADGTPGEFRVPFFSSTARNVPVEDLIPGVLYGFQGAICLRLCGMRFATRGDSLALELHSESPKSMRGQWLAQSSLYWRSMDPADLSPPLLGALLSGNFFWQSVESSAVDAFRAGQSIC